MRRCAIIRKCETAIRDCSFCIGIREVRTPIMFTLTDFK